MREASQIVGLPFGVVRFILGFEEMVDVVWVEGGAGVGHLPFQQGEFYTTEIDVFLIADDEVEGEQVFYVGIVHETVPIPVVGKAVD